jgi:hypothetical protein
VPCCNFPGLDGNPIPGRNNLILTRMLLGLNRILSPYEQRVEGEVAFSILYGLSVVYSCQKDFSLIVATFYLPMKSYNMMDFLGKLG